MLVLAVIVLILSALVGVFVLIPQKKHKSAQVEKGRSGSAGVKGPKTFGKNEVSLHNKRTDCWIVIKGKVFDVTSYVEEHPGGDAILVHAGDDSTEGFYGPQHGTRVFDMIDDFYIGDLKN